jgi:hypothetical protein
MRSMSFWRTFPLNIVGWVCCESHSIGTYRGVSVYKLRFWIPGFSAMFGDRIGISPRHIHPPNLNQDFPFDEYMISGKMLRHELEHIYQVLRHTGLWWIIQYGAEWLGRFFSTQFFHWYAAYLNIWYEREARRISERAVELKHVNPWYTIRQLKAGVE